MARNDRGDSLDLSSMGDDDIRGLVLNELREQPNLDADWIDVQVRDGHITLSGRVGTDAEIRVAGNIVSDVIGPESMSNELVIDEAHRGERAAGADEAAMEVEELESQTGGDTGQQTDTADHLQENLDEEGGEAVAVDPRDPTTVLDERRGSASSAAPLVPIAEWPICGARYP